ncbi:DUF2189 domain-containing protein [Paracoccus saliphilus]|uniref:DUF2189 domain-containing protein n=1 Tax=Paracoccus saliphilus TaxID=405559 RepID=A0AA46A5N5_9RHOB|nr:DUF2189 domain-containing protein [Paracoccus saliphilus]WCR04041.1 DUF2189 domain-containing protein [Paracoccus saliphilus]SIS84176.1 Uncharacterized membrane protein [Paracoccus saliphilus]
MGQTIGNPASWVVRNVFGSMSHIGVMIQSIGGDEERSKPVIRTLTLGDLRDALAHGYDDFKTFRSDVITVCTLYPIIGVCLAFMAFQGSLFHLVVPLISGFALLGPVASLGMYEMSRRREAGEEPNWLAIFDVIRSPGIGAIIILAVMCFAIFAAWLGLAHVIYLLTIGTWPPESIGAFLADVFGTGAGWTMMIVGTASGFVFALLVLMTSIVSFPLLLERNVGVVAAVTTSVRVVAANPVPAMAWGLIVAVSLVIGSLPALLGLSVVLPILGHATWYLYRKAVV